MCNVLKILMMDDDNDYEYDDSFFKDENEIVWNLYQCVLFK